MRGAGLAVHPSSAAASPAAARFRLSALPWPQRRRYLLGVVGLAAIYYGAAKLGYELEFAGPVAAIVWLPVGIGIAFLCLGGLQLWPGVLVGDLLANDYSALPLGTALVQTCGNVLEVVVAAMLIRRLMARESPLSSVAGLGRVLVAIAAGTAVSATVGTLANRYGGVLTTSSLPSVWRTWWLADACGALIVVPLALAWSHAPPRQWWQGRVMEGTLVLAAVAGLSELALRTDPPLTYLVFPALIWAAIRFRQRGATLAVAVTAVFTVWETTHHVGPFVYHSITRSVLVTQLYIAVAAITTLVLATVVSEREEFADRLNASRARLVEAAESERRRLEHNLHDGAQQRLIALAVRLGLASERSQTPAQSAAVMGEAQSELTTAIDELRELAHGIHPPVLRELGLAHAVKSLAGRSTVPVKLLELSPAHFDDTAEATGYYVVAEAITNAQKHARGASIQVRVIATPGILHIEVVDDGAGGASESDGFGLAGLRDRVEAVGGRFRVESARGRGTRVAAAIPATVIRP